MEGFGIQKKTGMQSLMMPVPAAASPWATGERSLPCHFRVRRPLFFCPASVGNGCLPFINQENITLLTRGTEGYMWELVAQLYTDDIFQ